MHVDEIKKVAVVGAGLMGHGIGLTYALAGFRTTLHDLREEILQNAVTHIRDNLKIFVDHELISQQQAADALARITTSTVLEQAVGDADFVTEAIIEDVEEKRKMFRLLDDLCPAHTIIASNTSSLLLREFGAGTKREDRQVITHWFNPPHIVPVVEVVKGDKTSDQTFELAYSLLKKANKLPVKVLKEIPGFLVNRVQAAAIREIWSLWEQGVASVEDIDLAVKGSFGFRLAGLGPLQICDLGGLDLWYRVNSNLLPVLNNSTVASPGVKEKVERGELGLKSGKGFYNYSADYFSGSWDSVVEQRDQHFINLLKMFYWLK